MKLPKVWGTFNPLGSAPGISKSNSLEIINAPFLSASGPGFHTYKKDGFTNIVLDGEPGTAPYLWCRIARRAAPDAPILTYSLLSRPETGETVEFTTNVDSRGVLLDKKNPNTRKPIRNVLASSPSWTLGWSVRIGGGWMLDWTGDANGMWPCAFTFENEAKNYLAFMAAETVTSSTDAAGVITQKTLWATCALGWNVHFKAYTWASSIRTEQTYEPIPDTYTHTMVTVGQRAEPLGGVCIASNLYPDPTFETVVTHRSFGRIEVELKAIVGDSAGNVTESVIYDTRPEGRAYPPGVVGGAIYCIGPGRLMCLVALIGGGAVPMTRGQVDPLVVESRNQSTDTDGLGNPTCFADSFDFADSHNYSSGAPPHLGAIFEAGIFHFGQYYPPIPSFVAFSEDAGLSWNRVDFTTVFGYDLIIENAIISEQRLTLAGRYHWACYIGEGKSLVFITGADLGTPIIDYNWPNVGCFLLEGTRATRLPWPGDAYDMFFPLPSPNINGFRPGSFGVGCYMCMNGVGQMVYTVDFGATWTTSARALINADPVNPGVNPVVPTTVRPCIVENKDGKNKIKTHARLKTIVPGAAVAPAAGEEAKLRLYEVMALSLDESISFVMSGGKIAVPGGPVSLYPSTSSADTGSTTTCVYYGEPGNRESPRPELGTEFNKPKKPT